MVSADRYMRRSNIRYLRTGSGGILGHEKTQYPVFTDRFGTEEAIGDIHRQIHNRSEAVRVDREEFAGLNEVTRKETESNK